MHFQHLTQDGFLDVAHSFEEHFSALRRTLTEDADQDAAISRFVASFLRPNGIDKAATPIVADACEALAQIETVPQRAPWHAGLVRIALLPAAAWLSVVGAGKNTKKWSPKNGLVPRVKSWIAIQLGLVASPRGARRGPTR